MRKYVLALASILILASSNGCEINQLEKRSSGTSLERLNKVNEMFPKSESVEIIPGRFVVKTASGDTYWVAVDGGNRGLTGGLIITKAQKVFSAAK